MNVTLVKADPLEARRLDPYKIAIGAVAALALLVGTLWFINHRNTKADENADEALKTAISSIDQLLTYTPNTVQTDITVENKLLTGDFKTEYTNLVKTVISPGATKDGVTTSAEIAQSGVISHSGDKVDCLLFVNMTTQSKALTDPRISGSRLKVSMTKVDGEWLVSKFEPI